jgi:aerobic carbon-monoxide dehydrogenase medium subunit
VNNTRQVLAPETYAEAADLMASYDGEARILGGGQSLVLLMRLGFADPGALISLRRVPGAASVTPGAEELVVGPRFTDAQATRDVVAVAAPAVAAAAAQVASPHVRNVGTVIGNICHADPGNDLAAPLLCHDAVAVVTSVRGERLVPVADLVAGPYALAIEDDEFVRACRIPRLDGWAGAYRKVTWRGADHPVAAAAVSTRVAEGRLAAVRVAIGGATTVARRLTDLEDAWTGREVDEFQAGLSEQLGDLLAALDVLDEEDMPADYRRRTAVAAIEDALTDCLAPIRNGARGRSEV